MTSSHPDRRLSVAPAPVAAVRRRCLQQALGLGALGLAPACAVLAATASPHDPDEQALARQVWQALQQSSWIADGSIGARRIVYVFTDPNCPYCNKFWADARPWVRAGRVQLRHVIVGILSADSPGKAAALLSAANPAAALAAYEGAQVDAVAKTLAAGHPRPLGAQGLAPLNPIPPAWAARLNANDQLMQALGLRATPALVWQDASGGLQTRTGVTPQTLAEAMGPR